MENEMNYLSEKIQDLETEQSFLDIGNNTITTRGKDIQNEIDILENILTFLTIELINN